MNTNAAVTSAAQTEAMPAPIGSMTKPTPSTIEPRGGQLPNQYTTGSSIESLQQDEADDRDGGGDPGGDRVGEAARATTCSPTRSAAPSSGTTTGSGTSWLMTAHPCSVGEPGRIERVRPLVDLHGQRQEQSRDGGADHHVGERQGLDDRIDGGRTDGHLGEHGGGGAVPEADREQQDVRRCLHDLEADDQVDEVAAGDDPVEADEQQPTRHDEGIEAHARSFSRTINVCSRNSTRISTNPAATSSPTDRLMSGTMPAEFKAPTSPSGSTFSR